MAPIGMDLKFMCCAVTDNANLIAKKLKGAR